MQEHRKDNTHINSKVLVNLHDFTKDRNILHKVRKLPAISKTVQQAIFFRTLVRSTVHLGAGALSRYHGGDSGPFKAPQRRWESKKGRGSMRGTT